MSSLLLPGVATLSGGFLAVVYGFALIYLFLEYLLSQKFSWSLLK